jgi:hypothetical protein
LRVRKGLFGDRGPEDRVDPPQPDRLLRTGARNFGREAIEAPRMSAEMREPPRVRRPEGDPSTQDCFDRRPIDRRRVREPQSPA